MDRRSADSSDRTLYHGMGDVSDSIGVPPHKIRYWDEKFEMVNPRTSPGGNRQFSNEDVRILDMIRYLLEEEEYTVEGARKQLRNLFEEGAEEDPVRRITRECDRAIREIQNFVEAI